MIQRDEWRSFVEVSSVELKSVIGKRVIVVL